MRFYFSGVTGLAATPEKLVAKRKPMVMLTFYQIKENSTAIRFKSFLQQKKKLCPKASKEKT
jgi:hypothetical protein